MLSHNGRRAPRRRTRQNTQQRQHLVLDASLSALHDDQILSFREWCQINGISERNGRRIVKAPDGPEVVRLSPRRIGITIAANRRWQEQRTRKP
jgi:predicted DNA-binding transcriptional regulator AlpA